PFEEPLRLLLLRRDEADDVLGQTGRGLIRFDVRDEAVLVFLIGNLFDRVAHHFACRAPSRFSMTVNGITPRARSSRVTCSNACLIARLMPNMNLRDGHAVRMAQTARPWSSVVSQSTRSQGP